MVKRKSVSLLFCHTTCLMATHFLMFASTETRADNNSVHSSCWYSKTCLSELHLGGTCFLLVIMWCGLDGIPTMGTRMVHLEFPHTLEKYSMPAFKYVSSFKFLPHYTVSLLWDPKLSYRLLPLSVTFWEIMPNISVFYSHPLLKYINTLKEYGGMELWLP